MKGFHCGKKYIKLIVIKALYPLGKLHTVAVDPYIGFHLAVLCKNLRKLSYFYYVFKTDAQHFRELIGIFYSFNSHFKLIFHI